jgi:hypothetical protein
VTREVPAPTCVEVGFSRPYHLGPTAEVALEDYARVVAGAATAQVLEVPEEPGNLRGVHLCRPAAHPDQAVRDDVEAFARELTARAGEGLGWS